MPKIFEYFGIAFLFYADEHLPVHIHALYQGMENKVEFEFENGKLINLKILKVKGKMSLPENKLKEVKIFATEYHTDIIEKWNDFFILKKTVKSKKITKRIK